MTDKPSIAERNGRAAQSTNLRHRERGTGDTDRLAAMAWADRELASHLYRARVTNDVAATRQLRELWAEYCVRDAVRRRWTLRMPQTIDGSRLEADVLVPPMVVRRIAQMAVDHWLKDVCTACNGRKFRLASEVMEGKATEGRDALSDVVCPHCKGTGLEPLKVKARELRPLVERCVRMLQDLFADAAKAAGDKLGSGA